MPSKNHLKTLVYAVLAVVAVLLYLKGNADWALVFGFAGSVMMVLDVLLWVFDKWLWSFRWLHPWYVDRPCLGGTWKGTINSHWENPATGQTLPPIPCFLVITQTFTSLHLRLMTEQSASLSLANSIIKSEDGNYTVISMYRNEPRLGLRSDSPMHHGGLLLHVHGCPVKGLVGHYWTDRKSQGEITFNQKSPTLFHDFVTASRSHESKKGWSLGSGT